ncbi:MAG: glycosyltransferase family 4 protein, partial [Methanosphaera sp.]|nr:glycosyltransferase family 4 protein [Methanosphaera sp.]
YFAFTRGGDVNVCYNLSKELTGLGHKVSILTTTFDYNPEDTDTISNLNMIPIEYKFNLALFIYSPKMKDWLDKHVAEYDIIHLHELRSYQNNIVIKYAEKYNIPYVLQPHASTPKHIDKRLIKEAYDLAYGNRIMKNAACTIAVSKEEAYYDKQMNAKCVEVVYNGMNLEEFKEMPEKGSFQEKYNINSPYFLYLGRIDKLKGINHVIESFAQLPDKYDGYKLVIIGKITDYKKELDDIIRNYDISDRVIFTGFIDQKDKPMAYHDASVFISPVKYMGGVSITVFESILSDTPVVVTKESGELIEEIDGGIIVEYGNIKEICDAIITLTEDEKLTNKKVETAKSYINDNLSWSRVCDKILEIYKKAITEAKE